MQETKQLNRNPTDACTITHSLQQQKVTNSQEMASLRRFTSLMGMPPPTPAEPMPSKLSQLETITLQKLKNKK